MTPLNIQEDLLCYPGFNSRRITNYGCSKEIVIWLPEPSISKEIIVIQTGGHRITLDSNSPEHSFIWKGLQKFIYLEGGQEHLGSSLHLLADPPHWLVFVSLVNLNSLTTKE